MRFRDQVELSDHGLPKPFTLDSETSGHPRVYVPLKGTFLDSDLAAELRLF